MPERKGRYDYKDEFKRCSDMKLREIARQAQEILDERDLGRNNLSVERFREIHTPNKGCQVEGRFVGYEPSGFRDCDGVELSASVSQEVCLTHGVSSQKYWGKIIG